MLLWLSEPFTKQLVHCLVYDFDTCNTHMWEVLLGYDGLVLFVQRFYDYLSSDWMPRLQCSGISGYIRVYDRLSM